MTCCQRYIAHVEELHREWEEVLAGGAEPDPGVCSSYREAINHGEELLARIRAGEPCPWHGNVPENYLRVMDAMKRDPEGFERALEDAPFVILPPT